MNTVNIAGLNKADVLAALWNNATHPPAWFNHSGPAPSTMTREAAAVILGEKGYNFDYLLGRILKLDLSGDDLRVWLYDRDNGSGMAKRVVENLHAGGTETDRV